VTARAGPALRQLLLAVFLFGAIGVLVELALLGHNEEFWQWIPIVLLAISIPVAIALLVNPHRIVIHMFTGIAMLFVGASGLGLIQHFRGNIEFELEMYPSMRGWELIWETLTGATPALAPGTMALLGLIGIIYSFRHPLTGGGQS